MRYVLWGVVCGNFFLHQGVWADVSDERFKALEEHVNDLQQDMRDLVGRMERLEYKLTQSNPSVALAPPAMVSPISPGGGGASLTVDNSQTQGVEDYNKALDLLKAKKFPEAKIGFQNFVEKNPSSPFRSLAHYWIAVIYYIEKDYSTALQLFNTFRTTFPDSTKKYDVFLKIAYCHKEQGNQEKACEVLRQCITELDRDPQKSTLAAVHQKVQDLQAQLQCFPKENAA